MTRLGGVLEGAQNFRDLGGAACPDGGRVAQGRVFRSEVLNRITDADLEVLRGLGIGAVCDLRHGVERERQRNRWPPGCVPPTIGVAPEEGLEAVQSNGLQSRLGHPEFDPKEAIAFLTEGYRRMPRALAGSLAAVCDHLLAPNASPLLIHCSAGKDRSGYVCAMLLAALGVSREAIFHDYLLSRERYPDDHLRRTLGQALGDGLPPGRLDMLVDIAHVRAEYLHAAFEQIQTDHGGIECYFRYAVRLDSKRRAQLRECLLTTTSHGSA